VLRGRRPQALKRLYKGLATARKLRMPYDEALIHYVLARWLPESDARRAGHLRDAIVQLESLGATHHLARARALLSDDAPAPQLTLVNR